MDEESAITATRQIGYLDTGDIFRIAGIVAIADHAIGGLANLVSAFASMPTRLKSESLTIPDID